MVPIINHHETVSGYKFSSKIVVLIISILSYTLSVKILPIDNGEVKPDLDLSEPPEHILNWAKENINEKPDTREQILSDFKDLIKEKNHSITHRADQAFLLRFLRCRNFISSEAYELLLNYFKFKEENPNYFKGFTLESLEVVGYDRILTVLPYREQTGRRILLYRIGAWDTAKISTEILFQALFVVLELAVLEPRTQILGGIAIIDFENISVNQVWQVTPGLVQKIMQVMLVSFPIKVHAVHLVHQPWLLQLMFSLFKPFLTENMKAKLFFHGEDIKSLHEHIDPKHLPEKYGGIHPDYDQKMWFDSLKENKKIISEMIRSGYEVSLTPDGKIREDL